MMKFKVVTDKPEYILEWIKSLDKFNSPSVEKIQTALLNMLNNPTKHTCLSEKELDEIFGTWDHVDHSGGAYGFIKCTANCIRKKMFIENPDC